MARIVDPNTIRPADLKPGDVMIRTITLHVSEKYDGSLRYRVYICPYVDPDTENLDDLRSISDGIPQGNRLPSPDAPEVARQIFPVVGWAEIEPDPY